MKNITFLFAILMAFSLGDISAQTVDRKVTISGKFEGHNKGEMDIVLTMFGFDNLLKIGKLSASGDFEIDLSANPAENLSKEDFEMYISRLSYGFQYGCGNPDDFPEGEPQIACDAGFIALWADNTWAGSVFPVSDRNLQPWMEDSGYSDAIEASFYKILLVTEDVELQNTCIYFYHFWPDAGIVRVKKQRFYKRNGAKCSFSDGNNAKPLKCG